MKPFCFAGLIACGILLCEPAAFGEVKVTVDDPLGAKAVLPGQAPPCRQTFELAGGQYRIQVDTCETPDLTEWAETVLVPVAREWYPKLISLLPGNQFQAPTDVNIRLSTNAGGVAATSGARIVCSAKWFRANLKGEAVGSVVHELVHVVQDYGAARRNNPDASATPGWLVEGIADYIRWFLYEPESHGADLEWLRRRKNPRVRYDAGYRITANFLNWATVTYNQHLVAKLNDAARQGRYREELWSELTEHSLQELGGQWKELIERQLSPETHDGLNPTNPQPGLPPSK